MYQSGRRGEEVARATRDSLGTRGGDREELGSGMESSRGGPLHEDERDLEACAAQELWGTNEAADMQLICS